MSLVHPTRHRDGFTLVELIVAMTIILLLTALGAALLPRFLDNQNQTRAVDQLTQWLLTAKQRAKRDRMPTGVRILVDPNTFLATQLEYVQQPDPYTAGKCTGVAKGSVPNTALFQADSVNFQGAAPTVGNVNSAVGELSVVLEGDYVELNGGGSVYYIYEVKPFSLDLGLTNTQLQTGQTTNYRIIRQPRRIIGEDVLTLPQDIALDMTLTDPTNPASPTVLSQNVPYRTVTGGQTVNIYEILFSPQGNVMGRGTSSGKITLWVRNVTKPATLADGTYDPGAGGLVTIQARTGFIAAHPIAVGSNPYLFTQDGRASGL